MYEEISIKDLDIIAEKMMEDLLLDRLFQQYWLDTTVKQLHNKTETTFDKAIFSSSPFRSIENLSRSAISDYIDELVYLIQTAVENFLRSVDYAILNSNMKINRDSADIYSVRIQVDRFIRANKFDMPQLGLIVRRIAHLLKKFFVNVSTPYLLPNCAFFSSSLCDLMYRFEEYCSLHLSNKNLDQLRNAIDDFYLNVVKKLNLMLFMRRQMQNNFATSRSNSAIQLSISSPSSSKAVKRFVPIRPASQKGYLLPPDLEHRRNVFRSRILASKRSKSVPSKAITNNRSVSTIEQRWNRILRNDGTFRKSVIELNDGPSAFKVACQITKEVVEDLMREQNEYERRNRIPTRTK